MSHVSMWAGVAGLALFSLIPAQAPTPTSLAEPQPIMLRFAEFDPLVAVPTVPSTLRAAEYGRLWIVQFDGLPTETARAAVRRTGGELHRYLPHNAYVVRMSPRDAASVSSLGDVRWVGAYHPAYRLEPFLLAEHLGGLEAPTRRYNVVVVDKFVDKPALGANVAAIGGRVTHEQPGSLLLEVELTGPQLIGAARFDEVLWIDRWTPTETDMNNARIQGGANYVEAAGGYTGQGVRGHVYEGLNPNVADFNNLPINVRSGGEPSSHGHSTATIVFGNGAAHPDARGLAPDAEPYYTNNSSVTAGFSRWQVVQELVTLHDVMFTTASWGNARTFFYTSVSADTDDIIFDHDIPWTQSQSNAGNQDSRPQAWAKNIFSIGGVRHGDNADRFDDSWNGSGSTGPADDGRIKPDLAAYYDDILCASSTGGTTSFGGTSGATPINAGHNALTLQMFTDGLFGPVRNPGGSRFSNRPHATTLKTIMVANATQYSFGPGSSDNRREHVGWGFPDIRTIYDNRQRMLIVDEADVLSQGQTRSYQIPVLPGQPELKVAMSFSDPAGNPSATLARINDLTLRVTAPDGTVYWGNHGLTDGNYSISGGSADTRDTVECVFVRRPSTGVWTVDVIATLVAMDSHVETPAVDADYGLCVTFGANLARLSPFGTGCAGSATRAWCTGNNTSGGALALSNASNEYTYDGQTTQAVTVVGFQVFTAARTGSATVTTAFYREDGSTGAPALTPVAVGSMTVGTTEQFYETRFSTPISLLAGERYWVAHDTVAVYPSTLSAGDPGQGYYRSSPRSTSAWSRSGVITRSSFRVLCQGGGGGFQLVPGYTVAGIPEPGRTVTGRLSDAVPNASAARLSGFSTTSWLGISLPFGLDTLGAPGCALLVAPHVVDSFATNGNGEVNAPISVPADPALLGGAVHQQFVVLDAQANQLGAALSNGFTVEIGR